MFLSCVFIIFLQGSHNFVCLNTWNISFRKSKVLLIKKSAIQDAEFAIGFIITILKISNSNESPASILLSCLTSLLISKLAPTSLTQHPITEPDCVTMATKHCPLTLASKMSHGLMIMWHGCQSDKTLTRSSPRFNAWYRGKLFWNYCLKHSMNTTYYTYRITCSSYCMTNGIFQ